MANENRRPDLRQVIAQIAAVDPVVAIELAAIEHLDAIEARAAVLSAVAATVAAQPSKIALIGVYGGLTPRGSWYGSSLSAIAAGAARAASDPDVLGAIVDIDSPGGTVSGTMEAAAAVADLASKKPCIACVNTLAASAVYWIASQCSEIVISPSGDVGSIGAMVMHMDGGTKEHFMALLHREYPDLVAMYEQLYASRYVKKDYEKRVQEVVSLMRQRYRVNRRRPAG